ncbi:putative methyltransferase [Neolecta irregularis DAH-3]|uniref:Putative methyltransferase n=1 Tax=Neolecta irregularis (strain DAH-3) TaxID=1198029 RepID=A0A1U7LL14_NEOID|nr:putative methyltransferase [Neolecta irregularis DAH-3]|eukprot:OLL23232.1 putative methyltransferase [Neolecta irregularis DAH-3]
MVSRTEANVAHFNEAAVSYETSEKIEIAEKAADAFFDLPGINFEGKRVLDFACGTGLISSFLLPKVGPKGEIIGIDTSQGMVNERFNRKFSGNSSKARAVCCNILSFQHENTPETADLKDFDIIVVSAAYHHIDDSNHATKCLVQRLRSGGKLLVFDLLNDGSSSHYFHDHVPNAKDIVSYQGGMTREHMKTAFQVAGLTNIHVDNACSREKHIESIGQNICFNFFVASGTK